VAHPVQLGWRTVLGPPYAAFAAGTFTAATAVAVGALTAPDTIVRYGAVIVLIGLLGVAAGSVLQLRHLLARPALAEDEDSLTADIIMRVEDARELAMPGVVYSLPVVLLFGNVLGWWNAAAIILVLVATVTLSIIHARTASVAAAARQAVSAR
jgi:hypothetical protein